MLPFLDDNLGYVFPMTGREKQATFVAIDDECLVHILSRSFWFGVYSEIVVSHVPVKGHASMSTRSHLLLRALGNRCSRIADDAVS